MSQRSTRYEKHRFNPSGFTRGSRLDNDQNLTTMTTSTLSNDNGEANDASYDKYIKIPLDIDNNPIRYDGNRRQARGRRPRRQS